MPIDKKHDRHYSWSIYYEETTKSNRQWSSVIFNWRYIVEIAEDRELETKRRNKIAIGIVTLKNSYLNNTKGLFELNNNKAYEGRRYDMLVANIM